MAFRVGSGQSINPDAVNTWQSFTSDGIHYMYGSYKNGEQTDGYNGGGQFFRSGGDDIYTSSASGTYADGAFYGSAWRSYVPYYDDGTNTTIESQNTTDFGNFSVGYTNRGNNFKAAQGKIFVGAPSLWDDQTSTFSRGGVFIIHPHRMRSAYNVFTNQTLYADEDSSFGTLTKGRYWDLATGQSALGNGDHHVGNCLAFADGKLFASAHDFNYDNTNGGGAIIQLKGNYNSSTPDFTLFARPNFTTGLQVGPNVIEEDSRFGATVAAGCGKIAVSDKDGRVYVTGISSYNSAVPPGSGVATNTWKEILSPDRFTVAGKLLTSSAFGTQIQIGCGRIVIGDWGYDSLNYTNVGRMYIYDLNANLIKTIETPVDAANAYFGLSVAIGSGRIVATCNGSKTMAIYNLDGDLITLRTQHPDTGINSNYTYSQPAVGFGRIFTAVPDESLVVGAVTKVKAGVIFGFDLEGNYLGKMTTNPITEYQDLGLGGLQVAPGRLYAMAPNHSGINSTYKNMVHEFPIHTSMTPYEVQAMEDGDL